MRKILLATITAILLAFCSQSATAADTAEFSTEHYSLHVEKLDAADVGRMLEEFHRQMTASFGTAPRLNRKLRVEIYADEERFHAALIADGQPAVDAGGYYSPGTRKAYLWVQPSDYFTRQLILHECAHQFHLLAAARNKGSAAKWYTEGLAEYYAMHDWDGVHLTLCTVPPITLEDYPARALDHFRNKLHGDLDGMITCRLTAERPESWALLHFLADEYPEKFRLLRAKLDHQIDAGAAWREIFGPVTPEIIASYTAWMEANAQPWRIVWVGWQQRGEALEGKSDASALAVLKVTPRALSAQIDSAPGANGGLIFGFESDKNFIVWQLWGSNEVRIVHRVNGKWKETQYFKLPPREASAVLSLAIVGETVVLSVDWVEIARIHATGQVGLYVQDGSARFRVGR